MTMKKSEQNIDLSYLNDEERELVEAVERGELKRSPDFEERKLELEQAAKNSLKKKALNIRLYERDIQKIKRLANRDGIGYQTLISSIVHRYAEGTLKRAD